AAGAAPKSAADDYSGGESGPDVHVGHRTIVGVFGYPVVSAECCGVDVVLDVHGCAEPLAESSTQVEAVEAEVDGVAHHPRDGVDTPGHADPHRSDIADVHTNGGG